MPCFPNRRLHQKPRRPHRRDRDARCSRASDQSAFAAQGLRVQRYHTFGSKRVEDAEGCSSRCREFIQGNGRRFAVGYTRADPFYLCLLPLVLRLPGAKIVNHKNLSATKDLHALFWQRLVAFTEIRDRAIRSVRETQRNENGVGIENLRRLRTHRPCKYGNRRRTRKELHQIDEVTNLADDTSATFLWILRPVFFRNVTSVYAIQNRQRRLALCEELPCLLGQR